MLKKNFIFFILVISLCGCSTITYKAHPFLQERIKPVKRITVMPMDVEVYKVTAGGVRELVDEYTQEAKNNIKAAINNELLVGNNYTLSYLPQMQEMPDGEEKSLFKDALALYSALDTSIIAHTYPQNISYLIPLGGIFKDKITNFDYTFGSEINQLNPYVFGDALLFIKGGDYLSTGGRIAFMAWATLVTLGGYTPSSAGPPHLSVALADLRTGDILWYNFLCPPSGYNFRNEELVKNFVKILLKGFPKNLE